MAGLISPSYVTFTRRLLALSKLLDVSQTQDAWELKCLPTLFNYLAKVAESPLIHEVPESRVQRIIRRAFATVNIPEGQEVVFSMSASYDDQLSFQDNGFKFSLSDLQRFREMEPFHYDEFPFKVKLEKLLREHPYSRDNPQIGKVLGFWNILQEAAANVNAERGPGCEPWLGN